MNEPIHEKVQVWVLWRTAPVQVLLLHTTAERGSFWQPVTGSIEKGETPELGAARELSEETGLLAAGTETSELIFTGETFEFNSAWAGRSREYPFYIWIESTGDSENSAETKPKIILDPKEHQAYAWLPLREALTRTHYESNKRVLKNIVQGFSRPAEK